MLADVKNTLSFISQMLSQDVLPYFDINHEYSASDLSAVLSKFLLIQQAIIDTDILLDQTVTNVESLITNFQNSGNGVILQKKSYKTSTVSTMSALIPYDNTVPQITEGTEVMAIDFTPMSATSKILIEVDLSVDCSSNYYIMAAVFDSRNSSALRTSMAWNYSATGQSRSFRHIVNNDSVTSRRYSVRLGVNGGVLTFNGPSLMGGSISSNLIITEFLE